MKLIDFMSKTAYFAAVFALLCQCAVAAEPEDKNDHQKQTNVDKLVANQPAAAPAASMDPAADKPMTINFSDFVKDGAGCGVPNLDTSGK